MNRFRFGERFTPSFLDSHSILYIVATGDELEKSPLDVVYFFERIAYYNELCFFQNGFIDTPPTPVDVWLKQVQKK